MILLIDNYDSFVYNLARYVGRLGKARQVVRNNEITLAEIEALRPEAIILSPGPCTPKEAGISLAAIEKFHDRIPMLGICLGHQCMGEIFGGRTVRAPRPMHGKTSRIDHDGTGIFLGVPQPLVAARYHSLITELPEDSALTVTGRVSGETTIMAVQHKTRPVFGLQFHPESILTEYGLDLVRNFLMIADRENEIRNAA